MQNDQQWISSFTSLSRKIHFKETPVSIERFICEDKFIGKLTRQGEEIYPRWKKELDFIMREPTKYVPVFTGAIGTGKSRAAIIGIAYCMYVLLCLRNPWGYFHKDAAGKMAIVFFNLNKTLSESRGFSILQNYLLSSEWFRERGRISGTVEQKVYFDLFEYVLASPQAQAEIGQDVILALMDEVDSPKATPKTKEKVIKSVQSALRRLENRFVLHGQTLGKFFIVASKQERAAFIDAFVAKRKNNPEVHIVDIPIWEAEEKAEFGDKTFPVMLGDIYTPSKVLDTDEDVRKALSDGFKIIHVPDIPKFKRAFQDDIVGSLRDFAGISVSYLRKNKLFSSEKFLLDCYDPEKKDPVSQITIPLGTKDDKELIHFLDVNAIRVPRGVPRCIHGDVAYAEGDNAYGLGMSCVSGWKKVSREAEDGTIKVEKLPVIETDFVMRIVAPEGDEIPMNRVRKFIIDLKKILGFNIIVCTFDLKLLSTDTTQILENVGIRCEYLSLDRKPEIYGTYRDLVKEGRWVCHRQPYLHFELVNLEVDPVSGKIDHPEEVATIHVLEDGNTEEIVMKGSKDLGDATAGSSYKAREECQLPPDVEVMKKAFADTTGTRKLDEFWWVDKHSLGGAGTKSKKESESKSKPTSGFKDIFERSQK